MRTPGYLTLCLFFALHLGCSGCEEDTQPPTEKSEEVVEDEAPDAAIEEQPREAFGVPFPPEVQEVAMNDYQARVRTTLSRDEVKSFYDLRLTDFEFVEETYQISRYYGLHEHQPDIEIFQRAPRYDTRVVIRPKPEQVEHYPKSTFGPLPEGADENEVVESGKPRRGQSVKTVTRTGEELAPGAKWGEPYVPPPGTPLAHPRYKSNWGKPFGEWTLQ